MQNYVKIVTFSIPNEMWKMYEECLSLIEGDEIFKELLAEKQRGKKGSDKRYSKNKQNALVSIKMRYLISKYSRERKQELKERMMKDVQT